MPSDGSIKKKEHEKLKKYRGMNEKVEKMLKAAVVIGAFRAMVPRLGEWLQQIPGTTPDISRRVQFW